MNASLGALGEQLRDWRQRRRLSQLDLACDAGISTRHLSFLETGRSSPSRDMLLRLADHLAVPHRERNQLLLAAGYAPMFQARRLDHPDLKPARDAVDLILDRQKPYPAFALDRHWNALASNGALPDLYADVAPELLEPPVNVVRLSLSPKGLAPRIVNLPQWAAHLLHRLREQIDLTGDSVLVELAREAESYVGPALRGARADARYASAVLLPITLRALGGELSFFTTTMVFGTPVDVPCRSWRSNPSFPPTSRRPSSSGTPYPDYLRGNRPHNVNAGHSSHQRRANMDRRFLLQLSGAVAGASFGIPAAATPRPAVRGNRVETKDGMGLHVVDYGQGPPVLLIHSWAMSGAMWDYQVVALREAGFRAITYDRRGHGRSEVSPSGYDYDTLADDLASVIEALQLRELTLVGHSMAGGEIVRYLSRHGAGRVRRVVLLAPTLPGMQRGPKNPNGLDPAMFEAIRAEWARDFPGWMDRNTASFFTTSTSPGMVRWLTEIMMRTPVPVAIDCNRTVVGTDFRDELPRIAVPTLILQGDKDASAPLDLTGRATAALIPGSRLDVIAGAPHGLFVTNMDEVNRRMVDFVRA